MRKLVSNKSLVTYSGVILVLVGAVLAATTRRYSALIAPFGHMHYGFWIGLSVVAVGVVLALAGAMFVMERLETKEVARQVPA